MKTKCPRVSNSIMTSPCHQIPNMDSCSQSNDFHWDTLLLRILPRLCQPTDLSSNAAGKAAQFGTVLLDLSGVLLGLQCCGLHGEVERTGLLISQCFPINIFSEPSRPFFPYINNKNRPLLVCLHLLMLLLLWLRNTAGTVIATTMDIHATTTLCLCVWRSEISAIAVAILLLLPSLASNAFHCCHHCCCCLF